MAAAAGGAGGHLAALVGPRAAGAGRRRRRRAVRRGLCDGCALRAGAAPGRFRADGRGGAGRDCAGPAAGAGRRRGWNPGCLCHAAAGGQPESLPAGALRLSAAGHRRSACGAAPGGCGLARLGGNGRGGNLDRPGRHDGGRCGGSLGAGLVPARGRGAATCLAAAGGGGWRRGAAPDLDPLCGSGRRGADPAAARRSRPGTRHRPAAAEPGRHRQGCRRAPAEPSAAPGRLRRAADAAGLADWCLVGGW